MDIVTELPERIIQAHPTARVLNIGPPAGISREHCGDALSVVDNEDMADGMGLTFRVYWQPTQDDLDKLANGGLVELGVRGGALVPHWVKVA